MHKIGIQLYVYTILFILTLFYPSKIGRVDPCNDANNRAYFPKSMRKSNAINKINDKLTKWTKRLLEKVMEQIESIPSRRRINKIKIIAKTINRKPSTNPIKSRMKIMGKVFVFPVLAMVANQKGHTITKRQRNITFDTDSDSIGIDNRCSACISNVIDDFVGSVTESKRTIKGFGGNRVTNLMMGTILWKWEDDDGKIHQFKIPNSYYVPSGGVRLLSPQHWAQTQIK